MAAINIADLNNAKLDVDHIDRVATSPAPTSTDRLGHTVPTLAGLTAEFPQAQANAEISVIQAQTAVNAANTALSARTDTLNAAAIAATGAKYFDTIAAGRAAVADGATFGVKAGGADALARPSVYRRDSAIAQTLLYSLLTADEYDTRISVRNDRSGYVYALMDTLKQVWVGLRMGGKIDLGPISDVTSLLEDLRDMFGSKAAYDAVAEIVQTTTERSGVLWAVKLADKKMPIYVDTLGQFWMGRINLSALFGNSALVAGMQSLFTPSLSLNIDCVGDSLTEGAGSSGGSGNFPFQLSQLYGGARSVANEGIGGQTSSQISIRAGGIPALITVTGGVIPADTSTVAVTSNINPLTGTDPARSIKGWLRAIDGTLVYGTIRKAINVNTLTFERDVGAGTTATVDPDTPFLVDRSVMRDRIVIIGAGTNDDKTKPQDTIANIEAIVRNLPAIGPKGYKRFGIFTVWGAADSGIGTQNYTDLVNFNRALKTRWPENVIDNYAALLRAGDGGGTDNAAIAAGLPPPSKMAPDRLHLNDAGYAVRAAVTKQYIDKQEARGWLPF